MEDERKRALDRLAHERLARIDERRDVDRLHSAGRSQREIAEVLGTTQPRIHRLLKTIELLGSVHEVSPEEMILRAHIDGGSRNELVTRLSEVEYTDGEYAPCPAEGKTSGTWDQVRGARLSGFLSTAEYEQVRGSRAAGAPTTT